MYTAKFSTASFEGRLDARGQDTILERSLFVRCIWSIWNSRRFIVASAHNNFPETSKQPTMWIDNKFWCVLKVEGRGLCRCSNGLHKLFCACKVNINAQLSSLEPHARFIILPEDPCYNALFLSHKPIRMWGIWCCCHPRGVICNALHIPGWAHWRLCLTALIPSLTRPGSCHLGKSGPLLGGQCLTRPLIRVL